MTAASPAAIARAFVTARQQFPPGTYSTGADVSRYQRSSVPAKPDAGMPAMAAPGGAPVGTAAFKGPTVRIARGTNVTEVPVGGK